MQVLTEPIEQDPAEVIESVAVLSTLVGPSGDPAESVDMLSQWCCTVQHGLDQYWCCVVLGQQGLDQYWFCSSHHGSVLHTLCG